MATVGLVGLASPAGAGDNSANAKACQKGGYVNYTTATGTRFADTSECVSYAAEGGTLVALPDLVPDANCTPTPGQVTVSCVFYVRNIGVGPVANENMVLQMTADFSLLAPSVPFTQGDYSTACLPGYNDTQAVGLVRVVTVGCTATLPSGETLGLSYVGALVYDEFGCGCGSMTVTAVIDPDGLIVESNETNNTFTQTLSLTS
jgi:hypothetical protein